MNKKFHRKLIATSLMAVTSAFVAPVFAQSSGSGAMALEEIIVTARRRDESLQDVPVTVNVVTSDTIEDMNIRRFEDLEQLVAGLELEDRSNGPLAQMRGVRFDAFASGANSSVEFYLNDALITSNIMMQSMFDVGMVEVLRGPQGTLRGKASPSGAIIMTTKRPVYDDFEGYVDITGTNEGGENLSGALNIPIVEDMLAVRLAYYSEENRLDHAKSFRTGEKARMEADGWRVSVGFQPTENLSINAYYQDITTDRWSLTTVESANIRNPGLPAGTMHIEATDRLSAQNRSATNFTSAERTGLEIEWDAGPVTINYSGGKTDSGFPAKATDSTVGFYDDTYPDALEILGQGVVNDSEQEVHEIRFSGDITDSLSYVTGAYYGDFSSNTDVLSYTPLFRFGTTPDQFFTVITTPVLSHNESEEKSYFGNLTYQFSESTELSAGLRYIDYSVDQGTEIVGGPVLGGLKDDFTTTIYTVSLAHNFTEDVMGYVTMGSSWRPGNAAVGNSDAERTATENSLLDIGPEESDSIEFGLKSTLLEDRLRLNATVFYQTFDDYPFRNGSAVDFVTADIDGVERVSAFNFLAPVELDTYGLELDGSFQITDNWSFGGTYSWAQGTTEGNIACNDYYPVDGVPDSTTENPPVTVDQIRAATGGDDISTCSVSQRSYDSPTWTTSLRTEYSYPVFGQVEGYVRLQASIYGDSQGNPTNPTDEVDSYSIYNLFAGLRSGENKWGSWEAMFFVKNLFDKEQLLSYGTEPLRTSIRTFLGSVSIDSEFRTASITKPREIGLNLRFNF